MNVRNERILQSIDIASGCGLEIGPLTSPIIGKDEADIYYLDHMSTEDLRKKYASEPVELDKIAPVDFVLKDNSLKATVGKKKFDYVIASHVIEHIPDTVAWLQDIHDILKPGGVVSLIIPDKRFTFDINRRVTTAAEVIGAHLEGHQRFTSEMMVDFASECMVEVPTQEAWRNPEKFITEPRRWSAEQVLDKCQRNLAGEYVDCHCFVYTPNSFISVLRGLMEYGMLQFEVAHSLETQEDEIEFYFILRKLEPAQVNKRKQLATLPAPFAERDKQQERITELEEDIAKLTEQIVILQQDNNALKESFSWRATKGLRKVRKIVGRKHD